MPRSQAETHPYFSTRFRAPDCHTFWRNKASGRGSGEIALKSAAEFEPFLQQVLSGFDLSEAVAAEAIRRILIDQARRKQANVEAMRRVGKLWRTSRLSLSSARSNSFAGRSTPQASEALGISSTTADCYWAYAPAWLYTELGRTETPKPTETSRGNRCELWGDFVADSALSSTGTVWSAD